MRRITRQHRIGVQRDDVADEFQPARIADDRCEGARSIAAHILIELRELASLSLPAHPDVLLRVPQSRPMEKEEHIFIAGSVFGVQRFDAGARRRQNLLVAITMLSWRIREIAEYRELQIRIAVGEILDLEMLERFF